MDRRRFLSGTANTLAALGLGAEKLVAEENGGTGDAVQPRPPRHNVLLLMSDQHKRTCMGVAGDQVASTPNLDRLAGQSVRFTNAYCSNPVCGPSRASLMTGLFTHDLNGAGSAVGYSPRYKTIAHAFNSAGYLSALIGKMHFDDAQTHGFEYKLDFNDWLQYLGPKTKLYAEEKGPPGSGAGFPEIPGLWQSEGDPWKEVVSPDGRLGPVAVGRPSLMEESEHFDSFVARESVRFLENYGKQDEPFFLVTSFLKPHEPFMPAKRFAEMYQPDQMRLSDTWNKANLGSLPKEVQRSIERSPYTPELSDPNEARKRMAYYYGSLAQMDDCAGQVLNALDRLGLADNTIVIYTADHGEMLGDLGLWDKFQFYEGSCGVPLLARVPGNAAAICNEPVSLISLAATVADLCDVDLTAQKDARSFADLIVRPGSSFQYGPVFAEFRVGKKDAKYMIRDGDYKYTYWTNDIPELYNLQADPKEMHNLAALAEHEGIVNRLRRQLFAWYLPPKA
ncbi:MAG TPA: sulfatase-like hydrolase/transferase [Acidobacteriaceae bacterium]|nr:sulfatase-like hydrolase/transferase [Acidobacteriaceae bacterium]